MFVSQMKKSWIGWFDGLFNCDIVNNTGGKNLVSSVGFIHVVVTSDCSWAGMPAVSSHHKMVSVFL